MNAAPSLQGALWSGNQTIALKKQLLSTSAGLYDDLKDFNFSTISVSTLNVPQWISTALLYVSDIQGYNFTATDISSGAINVNLLAASTINMKAFDNLLDLDVNFDFGLGKAIGGVVGNLGALVGGATIAVGTGAGLAIQGAEQGIATMIAGRPQNFINNSVYETINFTSQLQISTLGNAYPYYSSIFRTVSSVAADSVPGREIFTSTIFYPGQICIRSASDPINLITGDSNLNTSTIQSFGQWVPLTGLEPENIEAYSVSTINLQASNAFLDLTQFTAMDGYSIGVSNIGISQSASLNYNSPLNIDLGSSGDAKIFGYINQFNFQSDQPIVFNQLVDPGTNPPSASLTLGNGYESIFNVSSIYSPGEIKTVNFYASTITAETLNVISTLFLTSTNIEVITSTQTLNADNIYGKYVTIENLISSINFTTGVGNPKGPYDIIKNVSYVSTLYNQVSSLTNNILKYQLNVAVQDEPTFNMGGQGQGTPRAFYAPTPSNTEQWASTIIIANPTNGLAANLFLGDTGLWTSSIVSTGTFDLTIDQTKNSFFFTCVENQNYRNPINPSTFISLAPSFGSCNTYRFNLKPDGWWNFVTPAPPPYTTTSCNVFTISQDINDVNITTTDRLNITAGDTFFNGTVHIPDLNLDSITLSNVTVDYLSTLSTANFVTDAFFNDNIWVDNAVVGASGNFSSIATVNGEVNLPSWQPAWTSNYQPASMLSTTSALFSTTILQSLFYLEKTRPVIPLATGTNADLTLSKLGTWRYNSVPFTNSYALGTFVISPIDNTFKIYTDNNGFGLSSNLQVVNLSNASPYTINLYIAFPSTAIPIAANTATSLYWNGGTGQWSQITYTPWDPVVTTSELDVLQSYNTTTINTTTTQMNVNVPTITIPNVLQVNQINYGPLYLQPKMFRQIISGNFGAGGSDSGSTQITNGSMTFNGSLYHCQCSIASFFCGNGSVAFNSVILAPYVDSGTNTWYVNWSIEMNAATAGASWTISWNAFMFPNNMASP
jgi:hypothetical protein